MTAEQEANRVHQAVRMAIRAQGWTLEGVCRGTGIWVHPSSLARTLTRGTLSVRQLAAILLCLGLSPRQWQSYLSAAAAADEGEGEAFLND